MSLYCCPICMERLTKGERAYTCPKGHSFDRAKEGYVHLLPANKKHAKNPGDDKQMAQARNRFLSGGWYSPLKNRLEQLVTEQDLTAPVLLDSGCGEGYYTQGMAKALLEKSPAAEICGVDLSKTSLRYGAKRLKEGEFAVASVYHLPVASSGVDLLVNCFSPLALEEFQRVVKPGGRFFYVVPGADHLWEMKSVLYEKPYRNKEEKLDYEGFRYLKECTVKEQVLLPDQQVIDDLYRMTPYCWRTPKAGVERLGQLKELLITIDFKIHVYERL